MKIISFSRQNNFFKMADGRQTKKNSKESIVNKAIPKVVNALQAIILKSKDEEFRERCLQKLLIKETTNLACELELKLWEIAEQKLCVKQILNEDENDEQVVPGEKTSSQTSQAKTNSNPSLEKDPFDDLAFTDITYPLSEANVGSFYEDEIENEIHVSAQKPFFLPASNSLSSKGHTKDRIVGKVIPMNFIENPLLEYKDEKTEGQETKDDWLNDFIGDSFWMDKTQLVSSQNLLKRQRSPYASAARKIVATRSEPNLHAYNFIHSKEQERNRTEVVIISDEEDEHCEVDERRLQTKSRNHRHSTPSQNKLHHYIEIHDDDVQIIEPCRTKDKINVDGDVPDVHEMDNESSKAKQSPQLEIIQITDQSTLIHDFDALEENFDDKGNIGSYF